MALSSRREREQLERKSREAADRETQRAYERLRQERIEQDAQKQTALHQEIRATIDEHHERRRTLLIGPYLRDDFMVAIDHLEDNYQSDVMSIEHTHTRGGQYRSQDIYTALVRFYRPPTMDETPA